MHQPNLHYSLQVSSGTLVRFVRVEAKDICTATQRGTRMFYKTLDRHTRANVEYFGLNVIVLSLGPPPITKKN
jgi:hypothetical protein